MKKPGKQSESNKPVDKANKKKSDESNKARAAREIAQKKKLIEPILLNLSQVRLADNFGKLAEFKQIPWPWSIQWFRNRRYFAKVLYGLTIAELKEWRLIDSLMVMDDLGLQEKRTLEKQLAEAEESGKITAIEALGKAAQGQKKIKARAKQE